MSSGSSGGGGTNINKFEPPDYAAPYYGEYLYNLSDAIQQPYQNYSGQKISELNPTQMLGMQTTVDKAFNPMQGYTNAQQSLANTIGGAIYNPYADIQTDAGSNPYMGDNPYLSQVIGNAQNGIINGYQRGTAAQLDAGAARNRTYGNSGYQEQLANNQGALSKQLGDVENQFRYQNYGTTQQLAENQLNRGLQAQMSDIARGANAFEAERNRQMQAIPLAFQGQQQELANANAITAVGDVQRQYTQDLLNEAYNENQRQQMYPFQMLDVLANGLTRASGGYGTNTGVSSTNYAANPAATAIGAGLLGYSAYKGLSS